MVKQVIEVDSKVGSQYSTAKPEYTSRDHVRTRPLKTPPPELFALVRLDLTLLETEYLYSPNSDDKQSGDKLVSSKPIKIPAESVTSSINLRSTTLHDILSLEADDWPKTMSLRKRASRIYVKSVHPWTKIPPLITSFKSSHTDRQADTLPHDLMKAMSGNKRECRHDFLIDDRSYI
ncbi:hypothetical protein J6590_094740 [Homalodisca vitripennis]|nr:hypothetical protein J6590_094740 [Homalodisca vitripennis]